mgnify:CR=1 FL=1
MINDEIEHFGRSIGVENLALNDAGCSNTNLIVILNDNKMSISENVGSISKYSINSFI